MLYMKLFFLLNSYLFISLNQPMKKIIVLVMTMICLLNLLSIHSKSSWFLILFYLLMISGLLTLFMYMSSINLDQQQIYLPINMTLSTSFFILILKTNIVKFHTPILPLSSESAYLNIFHESILNLWVLILIIILLLQMVIFLEILTNFSNPFRSQ